MPSMNISLPDPLKDFVDGQVARGRYSSASEYVRELIRADERLRAEEALESRLLEGLAGKDTELGSAEWREIRKEAVATLKARKRRR